MFDLNESTNAFFPSHGWASGSSGVRGLRLPVMRLYQFGSPFYSRFVERELAGLWLQTRSPTRTLRALAVCLRDFHREVRDLVKHDHLWSGPDTDPTGSELSRRLDGLGRIEVLLLTLLRRLADELIDASRPLLFRKWGSV
jgi:hypothetical protein